MVNKDLKSEKKVTTKAKRKKISFKKVKKAFANLMNKIVKKVKELWNKFMTLPNKVRYIVYVWAIVFLIVIILIVASRNNNEFLKDYQNLESAMNTGALDYVNSHSLYPVKDNKLKLDLEFLKEDNYVYEEDINDKSCVGFSLVHYDDKEEKYVINSYINCDKYTTEGYSDYK